MLLILALASCAPVDPLEWRLSDGSSVASLGASGAASSIVLIIDPSDPFSCWETLSDWNEWRRETGGQYSVVLSRNPTGPERRRLMAIGVQNAPVLERGILRDTHTPVELLLSDDTIRFFAYRVRVPDSPLLQALRKEHAAMIPAQEPSDSIRSRNHQGGTL